MNLWIQRAAITVLLLFAAYVRLDDLSGPTYWYDEAITSLRVAGHTEREVAQFAAGRPAFPLGELQRFVRVDSSTRAMDTLRSVSVEDPQHTPLYYLAARQWALLFGDSFEMGRQLAALLSLLALAGMYWLCLELFVKTGAFESRAVCWLGVAAMALSPYQIAFAREHREYSLWSLTSVLLCAAFLRAARIHSWRSWALFAAAGTFSLYTHLLSALVLAACGVWLIARERLRVTQAVQRFVISLIGVGLASAPLAILLLLKRRTAQDNLGWTQSFSQGRLNFRFSLRPVLGVADASFWNVMDLSASVPGLRGRTMAAALLVFLIVAGMMWFAKGKRRVVAGFALALIGAVSGLFGCVDFATGSITGSAYRYSVPSNLGWLLAASFVMAALASDPGRWLLLRRALVALFLLSAGISAEFMHEATNTFAKVLYENGEITEVLNLTPKTVLLSDEFVGGILALLPAVRPDLPLVWTPRCFSCPLMLEPIVTVPALPADFSTLLYLRSWVNLNYPRERSILSNDMLNDPRFHSLSVRLSTGAASPNLFVLTPR